MRMMLLSALVLTSLQACAGSVQSQWENEARQIIQTRVDNGWNAGIAIALIDEHGVSSFGYGPISRENSAKIDGRTIFEIGSVTKIVTGVLLADMAEQGEVKLNDPVAKFLPDGRKMPANGGERITLLNLAHHNSGLPFMPFDGNSPPRRYAEFTLNKLYDYLARNKMGRPAGAECEYSNMGVGLLAHALAYRANSTYEELVIDRICKPLKMTDTFITVPKTAKNRVTTPHKADGSECEYFRIPAFEGAAGLHSTAEDLAKLVQANICPVEPRIAQAMRRAREERCSPWPDLSIGLCWNVVVLGGVQCYVHGGITPGFYSYIAFTMYPQKGVVLLSNSRMKADDIVKHLLIPALKLDEEKSKPRRDKVQISK